MPPPRALIFSITVAVANYAAITIGAFTATIMQEGVSPELTAKLLGIAAKLMSAGSACLVAITAAFSFGGWMIVQQASARSGAVRPILLIAASCLVALLPMGLALFVFGQPIAGLAIVFAVSGGAVAIADRQAVSRSNQILTAKFS